MDFFLALSFLTALPVSFRRIMSEQEMGHSTRWFPAVGAVIGFISATVFALFHCVASTSVTASMALIVWMALTRGLHLDGLADTFDGLGGGASRERALEIMKDSRIGTFGALAIGAILMIKFAALSSLTVEYFRWVLITPVLARWGVVLAIFFFPPARKDGSGRIFVSSCRSLELSISSFFTLALSVALLGWVGLAIMGMLGLVSLALGTAISGRLNGLTGDSYGCICEIVEALALLAGSLLVSW